ncbi:sugar ABC transporter substrate-binding protein [Haliovirga abyssi]|uniref:Xylose ABC transporter substrate-binding protein n=1 Tax=Haliovirga abyssi TaxID=2996794 RepID=A0AAU9DS91_9FUSO|nr:substrate-binding domain-containing protein [Haliovirga abyssi]BDU49869.1 xylose ABC transporter substrate-binding protein [Haliovirga abyssi]
MKKSILMGVLAVFLIGVFGVEAQGGVFDFLFKKKANNGAVKIGFLLKTMQEERYQKDKRYFIEKIKALDPKVEVVFDSANNDEQAQMAKFENMLAKGVKVIVLQPVNTGTAGNMVKKAHEEGVKVVGYDSMLVNGPLDVHITQDSWAVGKLQGEAMVEWLKAKKGSVTGNVALIMGQPGDSNAAAMSSGALTIINENPGLKLVAKQSHEGWAPDKAMATAENVLAKYNNNVDAFICNNSGMARGVIAALKAQGLADASKVFVAGSDADLPNLRYVAQGVQAVEIFKAVKPLAETAAEVAYKLAMNPKGSVESTIKYDKKINNGYMDVPVIVTPVYRITKDNLDVVEKSGFHTHAEIFGK